jgi:hypothetical protein
MPWKEPHPSLPEDGEGDPDPFAGKRKERARRPRSRRIGKGIVQNVGRS